jgi:hypothetical protein
MKETFSSFSLESGPCPWPIIGERKNDLRDCMVPASHGRCGSDTGQSSKMPVTSEKERTFGGMRRPPRQGRTPGHLRPIDSMATRNRMAPLDYGGTFSASQRALSSWLFAASIRRASWSNTAAVAYTSRYNRTISAESSFRFAAGRLHTAPLARSIAKIGLHVLCCQRPEERFTLPAGTTCAAPPAACGRPRTNRRASLLSGH